MLELKNENVRLVVDDRGNLKNLTNMQTGREYAGGEGLWRIIYADGEDLEREVHAENSDFSGEQISDRKLLLRYEKVRDGERILNLSIQICIELQGKEFHLTSKLENGTENHLVREFQFPMIRNVHLRPQSKLYWGPCGGECRSNIPGFVGWGFSSYMGQDNKAVENSVLYPGFVATNAYVIGEEKNSLYFGSHDESFQNTLHLLRKRGEKIDLAMVKYPYLNPGETVEYPAFVLSPYSGDWHGGARIYRNWANQWYHPRKPADSILNSNGWQRLILRHQYGEVFYHYKDFPKILKEGLKGGIDTLFLFGWFQEGHDAGYPEYHYDETQGGKEALKKQIAEFQANGGKVILYYNGQLIDKATDFYRRIGKRICIKNQTGDEHLEYYKFGGNGTAMRVYGNKVFVTACPACDEWLQHLKSLADRAIELGCAGVFFDQLGFTSVACFDPSHGHRVPLMNPMKEKRNMMRQLRDYVKKNAPQMSLGIEWLSDPTAEYADFIHSITGACRAANGDWEAKKEKPEYGAFPEWSRYIFPEILTTDREIRDDTDIPRRVNMNLVRGLRSDVEIYRCREILSETPVYQEYLGRAGRLRDRYRNLILNGTFVDHDGVECDNDAVFYGVHKNSDLLAVVTTLAHLPSTEVIFRVPGYEFVESDGLNVFTVSPGEGCVTVNLEKNGLAVLIFRKKE